jgi:hypothetical protein
MLSLAKSIFEKYKPFVVKMDDDLCAITTTKQFELLCDIEVVMGFACILPMLDVVHELIKFVQSCNAFVCDFVGDVKMHNAILYPLYFD